MAYLGKGQREDLFVLATELNLKFNKSMTFATLKDLIIGSEDYDEELTKNIHSTIVEDRKAREENLRIEEQKEKLRIEEREEKLRFEQLRLDEQKRKDEFELEKLRIQTQSKLGADTSKESDTKFLKSQFLTQITMLPSMLRRTIQNRRNSKNLQKKLAHSSLRKVYVLKRYFLER
ncbi:hypothetical protein TNCV_1195651 [Trichonephila clavipes]|nr:hypothetical protein TNCV_1195651 [Trichonephila clavipes]